MNITSIHEHNIYDERYKNISNLCRYKIYIMNTIKFFISKSFRESDEETYERNINILYYSHKILFEHNKLWICEYKYIKETYDYDFTIHDFIYYLIRQAVMIYKRQSKRFIDYDIVDLLISDMIEAYNLHMDIIFNDIIEYLDTKSNEKINQTLLLLRNIFSSISRIVFDSDMNYIYFTLYDLIYVLTICIDKYYDNNYEYYFKNTIDSVYELIITDDILKIDDVLEVITFYEQKKSIECIKKYEEELIIKTWNPSRLINWCFDNEDKIDLGIK